MRVSLGPKPKAQSPKLPHGENLNVSCPWVSPGLLLLMSHLIQSSPYNDPQPKHLAVERFLLVSAGGQGGGGGREQRGLILIFPHSGYVIVRGPMC